MGKKLARGLRGAYAKSTSGLRGSMFENRAPSTWLTRALRVLTPTDAPEHSDKTNQISLQLCLRLPYASRNVACAHHMKATTTFNFAYAGLTPAYAQRGNLHNMYVGPYAT